MTNKRNESRATLLRCPRCLFEGGYDDFDVMGLEDDELFCNECWHTGSMEIVEQSPQEETPPCIQT